MNDHEASNISEWLFGERGEGVAQVQGLKSGRNGRSNARACGSEGT